MSFPERRNTLALRGPDLLCRKGRMSDRHGRTLEIRQDFDLGVELTRKRFDNAGAETGLSWRKAAARLANPIVGNGQLPVRAGGIVRDGDLTLDLFVRERVLQGIHDEFGHDQAEALGLTRRGAAAFADNFQ